jgi:hypothetical protein
MTLLMTDLIKAKALANRSPWWERSDNPGIGASKKALNPERVYCLAKPFRVDSNKIWLFPGLSLRSNPGLWLANVRV